MKEKLVNLTDKLFSDDGLKIKKIAKTLFRINLIIGILAFIGGMIFSIVMMIFEDEFFGIGILISAGGLPILIITSYLSLLPLHAFGNLVDNAISINKKLPGEDNEDRIKKEQEKQRIAKIEKLHNDGFINDEEYKKALNSEK